MHQNPVQIWNSVGWGKKFNAGVWIPFGSDSERLRTLDGMELFCDPMILLQLHLKLSVLVGDKEASPPALVI